MAQATADLLKRYGLSNARLLEIPGGYPAVIGDIPAPPGAPTVILYAHYDVQPARSEDGWETDPWIPVVKDGRLYGRGAADNKSGIATIAGAIRALSGRYPVGIKVIIEGEEETASHLHAFVESTPGTVQVRPLHHHRYGKNDPRGTCTEHHAAGRGLLCRHREDTFPRCPFGRIWRPRPRCARCTHQDAGNTP